MSLPLQAIDRLFERLATTYGSQFRMLYEGLDLAAVKTVWAHELSGYEHNLQAIAWALEHLPDRAPNAVAFKTLCRMAPAKDVPVLPSPPADKERVAAELSKLQPLRALMTDRPMSDGREWARRILSRHKAGEPIHSATLSMARQAAREAA